MALGEHIEILRHGTEVWNRWRRDNPQVVPDLRGASLRGAVLRGIHLQDALLQSADLEGADLHAADPFDEGLWGAPARSAQPSTSFLWGGHLLDQVWSVQPFGKKAGRGRESRREPAWGADLWASNLRGANLRGAKLQGVNLRGGDLSGADLSGADLSAADLRDTTLWGTSLTWVGLLGADLRYARMGTTSLAGVDLSEAQGLDTIEHLGPSSVGFDTLEMTTQGLALRPARLGEVETFLRRAGLTGRQLASFGGLRAAEPEPPGCYISFSHTDKAFARWLYDRLQERGVRSWLHQHEAHRDDDSQQMVDAMVQPWEKVLLCCSRAAMTSWWIEGELRRSAERERWLQKERRTKEPALLGVNLDGHLFDSGRTAAWELEVKERLVADFSGWDKKGANLEQPLAGLLRALAGSPAPAPAIR